MNGFRSFLSKSTLRRSFRLAVQHKVILVALKYINLGNVVGLAPVHYAVIGCYIVPVADLKQNLFFRLRRYSP